MRPTMRHLPQKFSKPTGFSLVELMISIVVGLVVVGGVISIFSSTIKSHSDNLKMTRLNQELRVAMDMMVRDIRRAGYRGDAAVALLTPSGQNPYTNSSNNLSIGTACIAFTYDANSNYSAAAPTVENGDIFGFRLQNSAIQSRYGGGGTGCNTGNWEAITDGNTVNITTLNFAFTPNPPPQIPVTNVTGAVRVIRGVTITLTGQLVGSNPVIARTLTETVRVQNDAFLFP